MSDQTNHLELPFIMPAQAQKHVTHNEALRMLDALVHLAVHDRDRSGPPATSVEGDRHIVGPGADGSWTGREGQVALHQDGGWTFLVPRAGWLAHVSAEDAHIYWNGSAWVPLSASGGDLQNVPLFGLGAVADEENPFSARLNKALWAAREAGDGGDGDLRFTFNKEQETDTLSLLMQTGWSGRAEIGLTGSDDLAFKVSADGTGWREALIADRATGAVRFPHGITHASSGQRLAGFVFTPGGDGTVSLWRIDATHAQNPRTAAIAGISGATITLSGPHAAQFGRWTGFMAGVAKARVWNTTKVPAQSAWIVGSAAADTLQVSDAADIAGWVSGDTLQIGDPAAVTPGRVVALDVSPMMQALFGTTFRQSGIVVKATLNGGTVGDAVGLSPSGAMGSFVNAAMSGSGDGVTIIPCSELSPVSDSNLVFLRESLASTATVTLVSSIALLV